MLRLHMIQANEGDCFVVAFGTPSRPRYLLVDGGPNGVYEDHLRRVLWHLGVERLDLMVLSHVCGDHVQGLIMLLSDLRDQKKAGETPFLRVRRLWHNAFSYTTSGPTAGPAAAGRLVPPSATVPADIEEGSLLAGFAREVAIPVNPEFGGELITVEDQQEPQELDNLSLTVVGPTRANLAKLEEKWKAWIERGHDGVVPARRDTSPSNLSSIQLLLEANGKTILLTGDGRGDHLIEGLAQWDLIDPANDDDTFHVDALKLPHHGADGNVTDSFFRRVTADHYFISGNHAHDNPDYDTLKWLVEAAAAKQREITIHLTNRTPNVSKLLETHPPAANGYRLDVLKPGRHWLTLQLA